MPFCFNVLEREYDKIQFFLYKKPVWYGVQFVVPFLCPTRYGLHKINRSKCGESVANRVFGRLTSSFLFQRRRVLHRGILIVTHVCNP
jgi:hypothetical protein